MEFKIIKKLKNNCARLGILKTSHGEIETPAFVPVATQAVIKTLDSEEVKQTGSQILIANTYHLHLKPGEKIIKSAGKLHNFMNWPRPLMTDSAGFQIFSLGFGRDRGVGKVFKKNSGKHIELIEKNNQPKFLKITDDGVFFQSPINGEKLFIGPKESIKIQEDLGADIIFAFDECTSPLASYEYTKKSLKRTNDWAKICLKVKKSKQAIFGIVQGGKFKDLRIASARYIKKFSFDGYGIGGEFGNDKNLMTTMINWVTKELPESKPRHLLGIGYLQDIPKIIKSGIDLFDCIVPTHYARRGIIFTSMGELNLGQIKFLKDNNPLDKNCNCFVCQSYYRNYLCHLFKAHEITALKLFTFHNLYFFNNFVKGIREKIKNGKF